MLTSSGTSAGSTCACTSSPAITARRWPTRWPRRLVAPAHRNGGQAQYIEPPVTDRAGAGLAPLLDWMRAHLQEPLTVAILARQAT